ncbi:hypothetical protein C1645_836534 [Glomus cerebriforme]|uniref:DUF659 domain-containing protein n=1 Tax=Glomus cerebriforme TaxID=658196 RepID=A0A397S5Q7_9GLOM|nr:hypothetical protein C1645_836534 [Glomus cerebriforme]
MNKKLQKCVKWRQKSTVDNHSAADLKKQVIEDLIEAFAIADIPFEKVNSLLSFFKKHVKNGGSISQAPTLRQIYLPNVFERHHQSLKSFFDSKPVAIIMDEMTDDCARNSAAYMKKCYREVLLPLMPQLIYVPCYAHIINLIGDTWRILPEFAILKNFLDKTKEVFVSSPARRGRYLTHLKMHGIPSPCKIPLYNKTQEYENDKRHNTLEFISLFLQDEQKLGIIIIYLNFISFYASEFVQDLDFFQQSKKPVILFAELRL